jgi:pseudaminic acid biosynthesis-associated methylase
MTYKTEQEQFWAGQFGSEYIERNRSEQLLASNLEFFSTALRQARGVSACLEFGANIGMNLKALKLLFPAQKRYAIEINADACAQLRDLIGAEHVVHGSILEKQALPQVELALIKGVLIHINPDALPQVYDNLVASTSKYLLVAEYYNPSPVAITYRGHKDRLFKRDFAGEIMDRHPSMELIDYGFSYRRDPSFPQDDITWFLLKKSS